MKRSQFSQSSILQTQTLIAESQLQQADLGLNKDANLTQKMLSARTSNPSLDERLRTIGIGDALKTQTDKLNYEVVFGHDWGTAQLSQNIDLDIIDVAKRPKSRRLHTSSSVKHALHNKRIQLKSQHMKSRGTVKKGERPIGAGTSSQFEL